MAQERNMAEGTPGPGPESGSLSGSVATLTRPEQKAPKRPWHIEPEYDPKRAGEYKWQVDEKEGSYAVAIDPKTGKEVARVLRIAGEGWLGFGKNENPDPNKQNQQGGTPQTPQGDVAVERLPAQPPHITEILNPEEQLENITTPAGTPPPPTEEGGRGPSRPEGPRPPEMGGKEWETSPERGRWLVEEFVKYRTTMSYEVRYNAENGPKYRKLCKDIQDYVNKICKERHDENPWDPEKAYKAIQEAQKKNPGIVEPGSEGQSHPEAQTGLPEPEEQSTQAHSITKSESEPQSKEDADYLGSLTVEQHQQAITQLTVVYGSDDTPASVLSEIRKRLAIYFREARRKGLLEGADSLLNTTYQKHIQTGNLEVDQATELVRQTVGQAAEDIRDLWRAGRTGDPEIDRLKGVWRPYTNWVREAFRFATHDQELPDSLKEKGAFAFVQHELEEGRETYWRPGSWAGYYTIIAKTPEQFRIAADSFLQMIGTGAIGKSPDEVYKHLQNFKEQLGSQGAVEVRAQRKRKETEGEELTNDFMKKLRLEFEALSYIFGADYSNETYNPKSYNQFMMAMALHEGPERWVELYRSGKGMVAAFTDMFDKRGFMEVFYNPIGERGELDNIAQHFVQSQIKEMAIERGMGISLKDYDPRDKDYDLRDKDYDLPVKLTSTDKTADQKRVVYLKANLGRLGIHSTDKELRDLRNLYEGFEDGDAHRSNYKEYVLKRKLDPDRLPDRLRNSVKLGKVQLRIDEIRADIRSGKIKTRKTAVEILKESDPKAYKLYKAAYDQAEASFEVAFQMQGATAEKVRRSKGFFYVDRNSYLQAYQAAEEEALSRINNGIKSEEAQTKTKSKERADQILRNEINKLSLEDKRERWNDNLWLGWILNELKQRRRLDTFIKEEKYFYYGLGVFDRKGNFKFRDQATEDQVRDGTIQWITPDDRELVVDQMPVHLAEEGVQYVVTRTKIEYSDESGIWRKLDYDKDGGIEVVRENGQREKLTSKAAYRTYMVGKRRKEAIEEIRKKGLEVKFLLPKLEFNTDPESPKFGNVIGLDGGNIETRGLKEASDSIYSRYTTHTYWAYQPENRHMLLTPQVFEAAKRIRAGLSHPEDEDLLATMLLLVDPTLKRVAKFEEDEDEREIVLMNAGVEDSFQDRQQIVRDLFTAFLPKSGHRGKMRVGYKWEDLGSIRLAMGIRELAASQPTRFARRLGAGIAFIPMEIDSMPAIWGARGVSGAINLFADKIKLISKQGVASQFGITKFIDQMKYGTTLFEALFGRINPETGKEEEGLYKKPLNNSEKLQQLEKRAPEINTSRDVEVQLLHGIIESFGRLDNVLKLIGAEASLVRNAQGVLWLKNKDVFLPDGRLNPDIDFDNDTGTARHAEKIFFDHFIDWLLSEEPGGGAQTYLGEHWWYQLLSNPTLLDPERKMTRRDWIFNKLFSG